MLHDSRRQIGDVQGPHRGPQARGLQAQRAAIYARLHPAPAAHPEKRTQSATGANGGVGRHVA